jgi:hypothetical protein
MSEREILVNTSVLFDGSLKTNPLIGTAIDSNQRRRIPHMSYLHAYEPPEPIFLSDSSPEGENFDFSVKTSVLFRDSLETVPLLGY